MSVAQTEAGFGIFFLSCFKCAVVVAQIIQYSLSVSVNMVIKIYSYARIGSTV